ncbi:MAG TPA: hypothetical protein VGB79_06410 [Allosphingosinicella sp.]|jgi:hypothetical protein
MYRILFTAAAAAALAACGSGGGNGSATDLNEHDNTLPPGNVLEAPTGQGPTIDPNAGTATFDNGTEVQLNDVNASGGGNSAGTMGNRTGQ